MVTIICHLAALTIQKNYLKQLKKNSSGWSINMTHNVWFIVKHSRFKKNIDTLHIVDSIVMYRLFINDQFEYARVKWKIGFFLEKKTP